MDELEKLLSTFREQDPPTLAVWRLSDERIVKALKNFVLEKNTRDDKDYDKFYPRAEKLFRDLNGLLAQQERNCSNDYFGSTYNAADTLRKDEISVVFGGKYTATPNSITEKFVTKLVQDNPLVYTASRTELLPENLPNNVVHISCKHFF